MISPLFESASESTVLTGIANVGGTIAAIVLAIKFLQWFISLLATAYRTSIMTAWFRYKRRAFWTSVFCALDLHYFIATLTRRLIVAGLGFFTIGVMRNRFDVSEARYDASLIGPLFEGYDQYAAFTNSVNKGFVLVTVIIVLFAVTQLYQIVVLAFNVQRLRFKWRQRKLHSRLSGKALW